MLFDHLWIAMPKPNNMYAQASDGPLKKGKERMEVFSSTSYKS